MSNLLDNTDLPMKLWAAKAQATKLVVADTLQALAREGFTVADYLSGLSAYFEEAGDVDAADAFNEVAVRYRSNEHIVVALMPKSEVVE
ncbi:MAG: hypothetical protein F6J87_31060 [Spirulina sp. SIO3F2]|nr:hypothetical protein [Spirulina sp. SIO3F2]